MGLFDTLKGIVKGVQDAAAAQQQAAAPEPPPAILEPVEGIDIRSYSFAQARAMSCDNDIAKLQEILAEYGMDQAKWDRVNAEWQRRMSGQAGDVNATMAVMTEYGKYFAMAQHGQLDASGAEPCTLERYAEIGGAQAAWAQQGRDVDQLLQQQFGMNALDWSNLSQYWSTKIAGDYRIGLRYTELQTHYEQQYKAQGGSIRAAPPR